MTGNRRGSYPLRPESRPTGGQDLAARYDAAILDPAARAMYDGTGFYNVGDWRDAPGGLGEAARRLVEMHLAADTDEEARAVSVVLDAGCGLGAGAAMMADRYAKALVIGANLSPVQACWAARATPRARFAAMDAVRLAIADGVVDRVHSVEAAFHFDSRDDFLAQARRVLRPGGKAILTDITHRRDFGDSIPQANVWTGETEYRRRCEAAGLMVESLEDITGRTLTPFYAHLKAHGHAAGAVLQRRAKAAYYFVVLRKPLS